MSWTCYFGYHKWVVLYESLIGPDIFRCKDCGAIMVEDV